MRREAVTIVDVARKAGVSKTTVSCVLNNAPGFSVPEETRQRVFDAAAALGYRRNTLAAALRSGRMNTVGIVPPSPLHPDRDAHAGSVYIKDLLLALCAAAAQTRMNATIWAEKPHASLTVADALDQRVDGMVLAGLYGAGDFVRAVYAAGVPCVEIGSRFGDYQVHPDNRGGAALAADHLTGLGHRRIVHWRGPERVFSATERREGFLAVLEARGIPDVPVVYGAQELAEHLGREDRPTALFAYNDASAVAALDLARELGLSVPRDLSIVGFDDNILATTARPRLTSVRNPLDGIARAAMELLEAQMRGQPPEPGPRTIPTRLSVRESTAAPGG
jgi:LacI family transcriptional regulator